MAPEYIVFLVFVAGTALGALRLGERVYTLRRHVQSETTRLLLNSWLIWCVFLSLFMIFVALLVFGHRVIPGINHIVSYRWFLVILFGVITWGSLILLEFAWRRLTRD